MERGEIAALVEAHSDMVMRIAWQHCFNKSDSEDIAQEAFLRLLDSLPRLPSDAEAVKAWLIRVTVNLCKDWNKSARYRRTEPLARQDDGAVYWGDDEAALRDGLRRLRPLYRTVLYMYYYEGYKIREIAKILDLNENTVSSGLTRARRELRDLLTEEDTAWRQNIAVCSIKSGRTTT